MEAIIREMCIRDRLNAFNHSTLVLVLLWNKNGAHTRLLSGNYHGQNTVHWAHLPGEGKLADKGAAGKRRQELAACRKNAEQNGQLSLIHI